MNNPLQNGLLPIATSNRNLSAWANDGVLLLNTALTVKASTAGSHSNRGWEQFTDKVIEIVDKYGGANLPAATGDTQAGAGRGIVFMAWGNWALKRVAKLDKVSDRKCDHTATIRLDEAKT